MRIIKKLQSPENAKGEQPIDESLITRAQKGDLEAFSEIYDRYAGRIYGFVYRMVGSREDAEDITQDTFFLAYSNLKHLRDQSHFDPWMYRIARNEVYKKKRKVKIKPDSLDDAEKGIHQVLKSNSFESNPEDKLLSTELGTRFKEIFNSLPINYREALILATFQEMNYREISEIVGRSMSSVKMDIYRARMLLSEKMQKHK